MGQVSIDRVANPEERYTFISKSLDGALKEIDGRISAADCWASITRTSGLISKIEYFADAAKTQLRIEQTFAKATGSDQVEYTTGILTIFYNADTSEDSRITTVIVRDGDNNITSCENVFSTAESECS